MRACALLAVFIAASVRHISKRHAHRDGRQLRDGINAVEIRMV